MTNQRSDEEHDLAARLRDALAAPDELSCAEAEALLPDLVAAEQAGADVDADPRFAALLRHLDGCEGCMALYEALSEGVAALDPATPQPPAPAPRRVPTFFDPPPAPRRVVRLLEGLRRRFALDIPLPAPLPLVGTLGGAPQATLLDEALPEVAGGPRLTVTLTAGAARPTVQVALRDAGARRWLVELRAGPVVASATTDARGSASFRDVPVEGLAQLELVCAEE